MAKILITGGLGNIGLSLAKKLQSLGFETILYDNRDENSFTEDILGGGDIIQGDVCNFNALRESMDGIDGIVHLAAVSRVIWGYENPKQCVDVNIGGTINVLEAARLSERKPWVIFGSSREVYGEPDELPVTEDSPKKIVNVYGVTKITGEYLLNKYHSNYNVNGLILRFSNIYGSPFDQLDRVIPKFIINASKGVDLILQGGEQVFDFTYITDAVNAIVNAIEKLMRTNPYYNVFHVTTGKPTTLKKLAQYILKQTSSNSKICYSKARSYDVQKFYADPSRIFNDLGFTCKIGITEGINLTIKAFKKSKIIKE
ncbi:MAG: NAD-dependent epimerase/dehydratase family protein [Candidatus Hodarchaeales archaeon]|jgi:nucleoside-diphosphate-sugar epimerase